MLTAEQCELLAEAEHGRRALERALMAPEVTGGRAVLTRWDLLPDSIRELYRDAVRALPAVLESVGWGTEPL